MQTQTHMPAAYDMASVNGVAFSSSPAAAACTSAVTAFNFDGGSVRAVTIDGEPWLVGRDVADRLGYADPINAMKQHCRGVVKRHPILDTLGRTQEARILSEPDVLRLIMGSRMPSAARFERWVFEDVLPTIRRTGRYGAPVAPPPLALDDPHVLRAALLGYTEKVIALQEQVVYLEPKAAALDRLASKHGSETISDTAKTLRIRPSDLFVWLSNHHWIFKRHSTGPWRAMQDKIDAGYLVHVESVDRSRDDRTFTVCRVTPKGRARIAEMLEREKAAS